MVLIVGWFVAVGVGKVVAELLKRVKFNQLFEKGVWKDALVKAELKVDASVFAGAICKWILVVVFLMASVEILGLRQFASFLSSILDYIPNVFVAVLIFVVTVIIADIAEKLIRAGIESTKVGYGHLAGSIAKWSIWVFALLAILIQLGVATFLLQTLFTGFVVMLAIAGGLAFGLGGKDVAAEMLQCLKKKLKE